jgi:hypothetical protein
LQADQWYIEDRGVKPISLPALTVVVLGLKEVTGMTEINEESILRPCPESPSFLRRFWRDPRLVPDNYGVLHFAQERCYAHISEKICKATCNYPFLFDWHNMLMEAAASDVGLRKQTEEGGHNAKPQVAPGLFISEDKTFGICHFATSHPIVSRINEAFERSNPVTHIYEGEQSLLALSAHETFAYDLKKFEMARDFFRFLDDVFYVPFENFSIDPIVKSLIIRSTWVTAAIMPKYGTTTQWVEEEHSKLNQKVAEANPFFDIASELPPLMIPWDRLKKPKDDTFEELTGMLVEKEPDIARVYRNGKTRAGDRGMDFDIHRKVIDLVGKTQTERWLGQCKYSSNSINVADIKGWTDRVREHGCAGYWLFTNNDITPALRTHFEGVQRNIGIKVEYWDRARFQTKLNTDRGLLRSRQIFDP